MEMNDERILFSSCVLNKNKLWYISVEGYLMYMDLGNGKVSYAKIRNIDTWVKYPICDRMFLYKGSIYWVDQFGKAMHEYNIHLEEYYCYELPATERVDSCYAGIFIYENKLYMFPKKTPELIVFDMDIKQVSIQHEVYEELKEKADHRGEIMFHNGIQYHDCIYIFMTDMETVLEFHLSSGQYNCICLPQKIADISCAICRNNSMYILSLNGCVYAWDLYDHSFNEICTCTDKNLSYSRVVVTEHKCFLLPALSEKIMIVNLEDRSSSEVNNCPNDLQYREIRWGKYLGFDENDKCLFFANRMSNYMLCINKESEEVEWKKIIPPTFREEYEFCRETKYVQRAFSEKVKRDVLYEQGYKMLYLLLMYEKESTEEMKKTERLTGKAIWQATGK